MIKNHSMSSPVGAWYRFCGRGSVLVGMIDVDGGNCVRSALGDGRRGDPLAGSGCGQRVAHPVGNTGITSNLGSAQ